MRGAAAVLFFTFLTMLCWGVYGPTLNAGKSGMNDATGLRPFVCVGIAYFAIAIVVPLILLSMFGEKGRWTAAGTVWSLAAGAAGAVGALGVILALVFHGNPIFVMPLVFGCAPVVNTFMTMFLSKSHKQISPIFIAGLILVVAGAVTVLVMRPAHHGPAEANLTAAQFGLVALFTALTALCWGVYGPTLHKGQAAMAGSRLRPLICVGVSYFVIAVVVPVGLMILWNEPFEFPWRGTAWSLAGGATGAIGALGVIMAFNFGGKPVYVMPLIFGGAPVINTFVSVWQSSSFAQLSPFFYAGLIIVIAGAVTVLIFAPRPGKHDASPDVGAKKTREAAPA